MTQSLDFLARLDDLAIVRIDGEDASAFLHTQLSNDIAGLGADEARLAAYCTPKGRMLANMIVWHETDQAAAPLLALVKADVVESTLKRLRMFVLRAKVRFELTDLNVYGIARKEAADVEAHVPWKIHREDTLTRISAPRLPEGGQRFWIVAPGATSADDLASRLALTRKDKATWQAQDIAAGLGWVEQDNIELFIPQSLNYDLIGGVSFTKGCYPGQEIVARAHFRGTVKRRGLPVYGRLPEGAAVRAGTDIYDAQRPATPAGRIINVATETGDGERGSSTQAFVEIALADIGSADFRFQSPEGPTLRLGALPYSLEPKA